MSRTGIQEFGHLLVEWARDEAIRNCDRRLQPGGTDPVTKRWQAAIATGSPQEALKVAIPDIVDTTIASLLRSIDQEVLRLAFTGTDGAVVDLPRDGLAELCGFFMGEWRFKHSKERVVDDFADLRSPPESTPE
jgi:hypothetical protein